MTLMATLTVLKDTLSIEDTSFVSMYTFSCGHQVPIYEAKTMYALTRIIGHAKFNNKDYGSVFYRGQCKLYDTLIPSLIRNEDRERTNYSPTGHGTNQTTIKKNDFGFEVST